MSSLACTRQSFFPQDGAAALEHTWAYVYTNQTLGWLFVLLEVVLKFLYIIKLYTEN